MRVWLPWSGVTSLFSILLGHHPVQWEEWSLYGACLYGPGVVKSFLDGLIIKSLGVSVEDIRIATMGVELRPSLLVLLLPLVDLDRRLTMNESLKHLLVVLVYPVAFIFANAQSQAGNFLWRWKVKLIKALTGLNEGLDVGRIFVLSDFAQVVEEQSVIFFDFHEAAIGNLVFALVRCSCGAGSE